VADAFDDDLHQFRKDQRRQRRRTAAMLGTAGTVLILVAAAIRYWAEGLDAVQAHASYKMLAPRWLIAMSTGGLILGGVCVIAAVIGFVTTLGAARDGDGR
jgi:hypothetical protein